MLGEGIQAYIKLRLLIDDYLPKGAYLPYDIVMHWFVVLGKN